MTFAAGLLLLLWVVASILANGIALLHYFTKLRGLDLLGYGAAAGVLLHGIIGLCDRGRAERPVGLCRDPARVHGVERGLSARSPGPAGISRGVIKAEQSLVSAMGSASRVLLWAFHVDVQFPESLPDGLYVFKTHTTNVKVQHLTGLPADNYIPFAVAEFFLRGVSFKKARPILPGNEVSNRTILMSLVVLPFRVALGAPRDHPQLGTYNYLGRKWPDVEIEYGRLLRPVCGRRLGPEFAVAPRASSFFVPAWERIPSCPLGAALYVTNPYFIAQTIYTWPKALAGFFILLAWTSMRRSHSPLIVAALMALAYHSHPYAIVFAGCAGIFYLTQMAS